MKKQIISGFFIAQAVLFGLSYGFAEAATLPPGNPFYFMQDSVRSLRRAFTFSSVSKALLELRLVSERRRDIAEILTAGKDDEVILAAFKAYDDEVAMLAEYAKGMGDDRVLTGVAGVFAKHTRFFNNSLSNAGVAESVAVRAAALVTRDNLAHLVLEVFGQNGHGAFRSRFAGIIAEDRDAYRELYALDALAMLGQQISSSEMAREIALAKDDMAITLLGKLKKGLVASDKIGSLGSDPLMRFYSVAAVRDRAGDLETKNVLTLLGQTILQDAVQARLITAQTARAAIGYAAAVLGMQGAKGAETDYFIQQANKFFGDSAYDLAFQHGVLAFGAATESLLVNTLSAQDLREEVALVKQQYDAVRVKPAFIEKRIAAIADMASRTVVSERPPAREVLAAIREVKLVLALLGN